MSAAKVGQKPGSVFGNNDRMGRVRERGGLVPKSNGLIFPYNDAGTSTIHGVRSVIRRWAQSTVLGPVLHGTALQASILTESAIRYSLREKARLVVERTAIDDCAILVQSCIPGGDFFYPQIDLTAPM